MQEEAIVKGIMFNKMNLVHIVHHFNQYEKFLNGHHT
jgi:hypothetical protein